MAGSIGGVACDFVRGNLPTKSERVETFEMAGVNGYGAHLLGLGRSEFEITAVRFGEQVTLTAWFIAMKSLCGTLVSITTDLGISTAACLITEVGTMEVTAAAHAAGSLSDRRGELKIKGVVS